MSTNDSRIKQWSTTPAANGTAPNVVPYGWPEGMAPSAVNDTARQNMTDHRYQWEDAEWFNWGDTPSKASSTTFKVTTDVTSRYIVNRRLKIFDTTTKYATIISSSYSAPDTTIGLSFDNSENSLGASFTAVGIAILSPTNSSIPTSTRSGKNLVIGGNFDTNPWQRGTSFPAAASVSYSADRFKWVFSGSGVVTISKSADAPTIAQAGIFVQNCLLHDVTTADAAIGATDFYTLEYPMEGYDFAQIAQRSFTISFWHKHTKTGTYCFTMGNSGTDRSYVSEYQQVASDVWEYTSITIPASPTAGTWDYTNGVGLWIYFCMAGGANYQTTANTWQTGIYLCTANQVNAMDSTANNHRIALFQIEPGIIATPFELRAAQSELALCQRYFCKTYNQGLAPGAVSNLGALQYSCHTAGVFGDGMMWNYPVTMRTTPTTVTFYNPTGTGTTWRNLTTAANSGASSAVFTGASGLLAYNLQVAGDGVSQVLAVHATANADF